jgi:hypothetical protein
MRALYFGTKVGGSTGSDLLLYGPNWRSAGIAGFLVRAVGIKFRIKIYLRNADLHRTDGLKKLVIFLDNSLGLY